MNRYRIRLDPAPIRVLILVLILIFSNTLAGLALPADQDYVATAVPGNWSGLTSLGYPVSFTVNQAGTQWTNFKLITLLSNGFCSVQLTSTALGPGAITNNHFSFTSSNLVFSFSGTFSSASVATGTFKFTNQVTGCGTFSQSGTWSATGPQVLYSITGNAGTGGATLNYVDGIPKTATANSNGAYSISVPAGWTGSVIPSKSGYTFTPPNRSYTNIQSNKTSQNYTASPVSLLLITGNAGVGGATLFYVNGIATADGNGIYSILVPAGWTGSVTPSKPGYTFIPPSRSYTNIQSNQTSQNYTAQAPVLSKDTTGVFRPSNGALYLKNTNETGFADIAINYGLPGDYPVVGDWDGNGTATIGIYRNGSFYLRNSNTIGFADLVFAFGAPGDQPMAGDWNGDGIDTIGVYRNGTFFLRNSNSSGAPELSFALGSPGDVGIAGDWNGDGLDTTGVFRPSNGALYLKNTNVTGFADIVINYGLPGDMPVTGDWNNDGVDTIGVYRNGTFYLRNSNTIGFADLVFALGVNGDMPIAGNWDGLP